MWESDRRNPGFLSDALDIVPGMDPMVQGLLESFMSMIGFAELPSIEAVAKHFPFTAASDSSDADFLSVRVYSPFPPELAQ